MNATNYSLHEAIKLVADGGMDQNMLTSLYQQQFPALFDRISPSFNKTIQGVTGSSPTIGLKSLVSPKSRALPALHLSANASKVFKTNYSQSSMVSKTFASPNAAPSNVDIKKHLFDKSKGSEISIQEFQSKNIGDLKEFKKQKLEKSKAIIEKVHAGLREKRKLLGDIIDLASVETHLTGHQRQVFHTIENHKSALQSLKAVNVAFLPVLDYTISFKPELGMCLQRLVESYNLILLDQFQAYYQHESSQAQEIQKQRKAVEQQSLGVEAAKKELYAQQDMVKAIINSKDKEISQLQALLALAQNQVEELSNFKQDKSIFNAEEQAARAKIQNTIKDSDDSSTGSYLQFTVNQISANTMDDVLNEFQQTQHVRQNNLGNLNKIVGRLMNKGMVDTATQTEELEQNKSGHVFDDQSVQHHSQSQLHSLRQSVEGLTYEQQLDFTTKPGGLQEKSNNDRFREYQMRLNELLNTNKTRKTEARFTWSVSNLVLLFLENSIKRYSRQPVYGSDLQTPQSWLPAEQHIKPQLIPWAKFKTQLFEILDHRILHAEEIDGGTNNTYLPFDEHLIVVLFERYQVRSAVERNLIDFLSSLKYYASGWQRAKIYAQMLGFYQSDQSFARLRQSGTSETRLPERANDGLINELEEPFFDIYLAEFYIVCYNRLAQERKTFQESEAGFTYVPLFIEQKVTQEILLFMPQGEYPQWNIKIRRMCKSIKQDDTDSFNQDYIDLDQLLSMYVDEFRTYKQINAKKMQKAYQAGAKPQVGQKELTINQFHDIVQESRKEVTVKPQPFMQYSGPVTTTRAVLYALLTGKNGLQVNEIEFAVGCNRFGIVCPMPTTKQRLALFGNSKEITQLLNKKNPDVSRFGQQDLVATTQSVERDLNETAELEPFVKKRTAIQSMKLLGLSQSTESPPVAMHCRGLKIRIKDFDGTEQNKPWLEASLTNHDVGVQGEKNIIVPSFGTTSALFARHFNTLRQLRRRVDLLKQTYYDQMDPQKCWVQIEAIIDTMDTGCRYLGTEEVAAGTEKDAEYDDACYDKDARALQREKEIREHLKNALIAKMKRGDDLTEAELEQYKEIRSTEE